MSVVRADSTSSPLASGLAVGDRRAVTGEACTSPQQIATTGGASTPGAVPSVSTPQESATGPAIAQGGGEAPPSVEASSAPNPTKSQEAVEAAKTVATIAGMDMKTSNTTATDSEATGLASAATTAKGASEDLAKEGSTVVSAATAANLATIPAVAPPLHPTPNTTSSVTASASLQSVPLKCATTSQVEVDAIFSRGSECT